MLVINQSAASRIIVLLLLIVVVAADFVRCDDENDEVHHPILGGYSAVDVNDESVQEMATFATNKLRQVLNGLDPRVMMRVVQAESQVVSGINYKLELELKEAAVAGEEKTMTSSSIKCQVVIYDQSWSGTRHMTSCSCCGESWTAGLPDKITTPLPTLIHHIEPLPTLDVADAAAAADETTDHHHHQHATAANSSAASSSASNHQSIHSLCTTALFASIALLFLAAAADV